ncbi:hypothetical protein E3N88_07313 [Mikania micrantha]|uniref:F-box domain-containing protein n=1 Tax=Mikania micrantha TaxID=192012 RepID=A0A5N6PTB6_9ASTR|nr:hypothetical protein E3N88_07313 [Mikania micrantha]
MTAITSLADVHPDIIQTHILPRLHATATATATAVSSYLQALCSDDDNLWSVISKSTWPSITHPRVDGVISAFPAGHRSFFEDSFPLLITDVNNRRRRRPSSSQLQPSELISAIDVRYQNEIVFSTVEFTNTGSADSLSSALSIESNNEPTNNGCRIFSSIGLKAGDMIDPTNEATLSHLKDSVTLSWILINPRSKRAGNLSSIKPVSAKPGWMPNEAILRYTTVLPGYDPNEMVECRIEVVLEGVDEGLQVQDVVLKLLDMDSICLNGGEFLVITQGAISEENNVKRRVVDDEGLLASVDLLHLMQLRRSKVLCLTIVFFRENYPRKSLSVEDVEENLRKPLSFRSFMSSEALKL